MIMDDINDDSFLDVAVAIAISSAAVAVALRTVSKALPVAGVAKARITRKEAFTMFVNEFIRSIKEMENGDKIEKWKI